MTQGKHWTEENVGAFVQRIGFDFVTQIEKVMEAEGISQADVAQKLGVTESLVSQILNNRRNLTLKTIIKLARSVGMKAAILAYNDSDPGNDRGPIHSETFVACWELVNRPRDLGDMEDLGLHCATKDVLPSAGGETSHTAQTRGIISIKGRKNQGTAKTSHRSPYLIQDGAMYGRG